MQQAIDLMNDALQCGGIVSQDIGCLQVHRASYLLHEQICVLPEVLDNPGIPLIDQGIKGRSILSPVDLFLCLTKLEGQTHAIDYLLD